MAPSDPYSAEKAVVAPLTRRAGPGAVIAAGDLEGRDPIDAGRVVRGGPEGIGLPRGVPRAGVVQAGRTYILAVTNVTVPAVGGAVGGLQFLRADLVLGAHLKPRTEFRFTRRRRQDSHPMRAINTGEEQAEIVFCRVLRRSLDQRRDVPLVGVTILGVV